MKKERTLRQMLVPVLFLVTGVPLLLFSVVSQYRLRSSLNENLEIRTENAFGKVEEGLNMVLDKYDSILYDFCTDDEVIALVEEINQSDDTLEVNSNNIRRELSNICNRNDGIEGLTIVTDSGTVLFYDRISASSVESDWADEVVVPEVTEGAYYQTMAEPVESGDGSMYMIQIARQMVDYRDIRKSIGTVVVSIDESVLDSVLYVGEDAKSYLLEDDVVVASDQNSQIGQMKNELEQEGYRYSEAVNDTSGFTIYLEQSLEQYRLMTREQILFWILVALSAFGLIYALAAIFTRPYLKEIDRIAQAMGRVEEGDLEVTIPEQTNMPTEFKKISSGFNDMVFHIDALIEQVRVSVEEQKNAELAALEAQIDPHFLYNTLDTINWKAIELGQFEISEMVGALADILRYTVKNAGAETSIDQEVHWLEQYIYLQNFKYGATIHTEIQAPEELLGYRIHKLLLQPFIENAMKYGLGEKDGERWLKVTMKAAGQQIHILIEDNGVGIDAETLRYLNMEDGNYEQSHVGVANVRKRLRLYYGEEANLYIESKEGNGTKVHLFIPAVS